jgi:hypothetical protein
LRAKKAFLIAVENGGRISPAMREAGYSPATAENPSKLTKTKAWQDLMEEYLPESLLAKKHKELLTVPIKRTRKINGTAVVEEESLDVQAVSKGLDMAYKLTGKYAPEKKEISGTLSLTSILTDDVEDANDGLLQDDG